MRFILLSLISTGFLHAHFNEMLRATRIGFPADAFPLFTERADKLLAKKYVLENELKVLQVPEVYYETTHPRQIPFDTLPDRFVIKANHGTHMNIFVADKKSLDRKLAIARCYSFLMKKHGKHSGENWYLNIRPKIFIEEFIDEARVIRFYCIHGKVAFLDFEALNECKYVYLSIDWKRLEIYDGDDWTVLAEEDYKCQPKNLSLMIADCEKLVKEFDFVRFDVLYSHGNYYFSEFTFAPTGLQEGYKYSPQEFENGLGEMFLSGCVDYEKINQFLWSIPDCCKGTESGDPNECY